jgi:hypothetical protein
MNGRLPAWLAEWLGVELPTSSDVATWQLDSSWRVPPWATLVVVVAAVLWTVMLYMREASAASRAYRALLVALRVTAIAILLIMLAQWVLALRLTGPPSLAVIIDRSASMDIADHYADTGLAAEVAERLGRNNLSKPTRLNLAKAIVTGDDARLLAEIDGRYRLEVYLAAGGVERQPRSTDFAEKVSAIRELAADGPDSQATRLGNAVRHVLNDFRGVPPTSIVLLTDGVNTDGLSLADAALEARMKGVPLFPVGLGSDSTPRDIELADVLVDDVVFIDDLVSFHIQVKSSGLDGQPAEVILRRVDTETAPGENLGAVASVITKASIRLPAAGETLTLQLIDRPTKAGDVHYFIEVSPWPEETNQENNRQEWVVAVRDQRIRVLMAFGYPNYEFRFLKSLLERDSTIELATYLQDADPQYAEQDKTALSALPSSRDELFAYDVVLVGDVDPRLAPRSLWQNMRAFVAEKGGGTAFIAGPRFLPWRYGDVPDVSAILPIDVDMAVLSPGGRLPASVSSGFRVLPTPLGLRTAAMQLGNSAAESEQIWLRLAPLYWLAEVRELKPAAQLLAVGPSADGIGNEPARGNAQSAMPVICFQYFGAGRVLFHAFDSTWRWRAQVGDVFFARYWVQTIRHLARGKLIEGHGADLTSDRREYDLGEPVQLRARFRDGRLAPSSNEVSVLVDAPGQARRRIALFRNPTTANLFEGATSDLAVGQYQALLVEPQVPGDPPAARFAVVAPAGEMARTAMDRTALVAAAETTRGQFYTPADADQLLDELPRGRRVPIENLPLIPIWNRWWLLSAFLTCVTSEWILRKRKGML